MAKWCAGGFALALLLAAIAILLSATADLPWHGEGIAVLSMQR